MTALEDAKRLIELAEATSAGPWTTNQHEPFVYADTVWLIDCGCDGDSLQQDIANAAFIAHARNTGPEIATALIEAREREMRLHLVLTTIAELPIPEQDTMISANMRGIARAALKPQPEKAE